MLAGRKEEQMMQEITLWLSESVAVAMVGISLGEEKKKQLQKEPGTFWFLTARFPDDFCSNTVL